jgi:hypothetical protein
MAVEISEVKRQIQDHLEEGLLLVVGTGLSATEGIAGITQRKALNILFAIRWNLS